MKKDLFLVVFLILISLYSCKKNESKITDQNLNKTENYLTNLKIAKLNSPEMKSGYDTLLSMLNSKKITFHEFKTTLDFLLTRFKTLDGKIQKRNYVRLNTSITKRVACSGSNPFDACYWTYIPEGCPTPDDDDACANYYHYDCMSFCEEAYFRATDELTFMEEGETAKYLADVNKCYADFVTNSDLRRICLDQALISYSTAMNSIWQGYTTASEKLYECQDNCPPSA